MNYAIVHTGGKQYRVKPGDTIAVEKIDADEGSTIELDRVLLVAQDSGVQVGRPTVDGAKVVAEVAAQGRAAKIIVFKYKPKVRRQVKRGHRQLLTQLSIREIVTGGQAPSGREEDTDGA